MTTYVLDASAVLRYINNEAGGVRVGEILVDGVLQRAQLCVSAVQWGEIAGKLRKSLGAGNEGKIMHELLLSGLDIISVDADCSVRAARLKVDRKISYADAFAVDLAMRSPEYVLVTADYDFKAVEDLAKIEFLPAK
jgi:PIN domain nuclease of toxin-antitoxin system